MTPTTIFITHLLGFLTVLTQITVIAGLLLFWFAKKQPIVQRLTNFFGQHALIFSWIVCASAVFSSLYYSDIAHLVPCSLCWWQRIFIFPQLVLLTLALWKNDERISDYLFGLSGIGALIALYHYYGQMFSSAILPCGVSGGTPSCANKTILEFGYVTIPMMSLTYFLIIFFFMILLTSYKKNK